MGLFSKKKKAEPPVYFGNYYLDFDAIKSIKDIKLLLQSQWSHVNIDSEEKGHQYDELIKNKILIQHVK